MTKLKKTRKAIGLTQNEAARAAGVSRRTYQTYEASNPNQVSEEQQKELERVVEMLEAYSTVDFDHGILSRKAIIEGATEVFRQYPQVSCSYLFGSYARREAKPQSDVDFIVVLDDTMGLSFYGMIADLEDRLNKRVDVVTHRQLEGSANLISQVLIDGVRIYLRDPQ